MANQTLSQETVQDDAYHLHQLLAVAHNLIVSQPAGGVQADTVAKTAALIRIGRDMAENVSLHLLEDFAAHAKAAEDAAAGR